MEAIRSSWVGNEALIVVGFLFLVVGISVPKFQLYFLIAGLNGLRKQQLAKFNLRYIEKYFGMFMIVLWLLTIVDPFFWTIMDQQQNIGSTFIILLLVIIIQMFVFGFINIDKIYNS